MPFLWSSHIEIMPPSPVPTTCGRIWLFPAVHTGVFTAGSEIHCAAAENMDIRNNGIRNATRFIYYSDLL
jgi:hypothetical protein